MENIDKKYIWHPFTQEFTAGENIKIVKGEGLWLWDENGKKYADLVASWWTACHGHCNRTIAEAIAKQALELDHLMFANLTHNPAIELVQELRQFLAPSLTKFFFSDNGSTALEIALKMTHQYWKNKGELGRNIFITMEGNYHGDTVGAMSLGKSCGFYTPFEDLLIPMEYLPCPHTYWNDEDVEAKEEKALKSAKQLLKEKSDKICAFFLESLVQGASGMRFLRPSFITKICTLFKSYNIPVVFDEVMTGFGRTGTMFAYQQTDVVPDIICLSKALTGGVLPMALTVVQQHIYDAFYSADADKTFLHGHSYTANPITCAAALASLKLFRDGTIIEKIANIQRIHTEELQKLQSLDFLEKFRTTGLIAAFEIKNCDGYGSNFSNRLKQEFFKNRLILRPLGNVIYLLPPYCITEEELRDAYSQIRTIIIENKK